MPRPCRTLAVTLLTAGALGLQAGAVGQRPVDLGPKVGERVPAFSATDQSGATRTLESILGPKGAMLVFFRSADW